MDPFRSLYSSTSSNLFVSAAALLHFTSRSQLFSSPALISVIFLELFGNQHLGGRAKRYCDSLRSYKVLCSCLPLRSMSSLKLSNITNSSQYSVFLNVLSLHLLNHFSGKKSALRESSKIRVSAGGGNVGCCRSKFIYYHQSRLCCVPYFLLAHFIQSFIIHSCCKYQHSVFLLCSLSLLFHYIFKFLFEFLYKTSKKSNY